VGGGGPLRGARRSSGWGNVQGSERYGRECAGEIGGARSAAKGYSRGLITNVAPDGRGIRKHIYNRQQSVNAEGACSSQ
jgi:hypothetical protein